VAPYQHSLPVEIGHQRRCGSAKSNRFGGTRSILTNCKDQTPKQMLLRKIKQIWWHNQDSQTVEIRHQSRCHLAKLIIFEGKINTHSLQRSDTKADVTQQDETDLVSQNQHSLPVEIGHQSRCCSEKSSRFDTKSTLTRCKDWTPKWMLLRKIEHN